LDNAKKNVAVLAACQALLFTNNSTVIALNGLVGYALASNKALATLPVTGWVLGGALSTLAMSLLMKRIGRRGIHRGGGVVGVVQLLDIPSPPGDDRKDSARPLKEIMAQPVFIARRRVAAAS